MHSQIRTHNFNKKTKLVAGRKTVAKDIYSTADELAFTGENMILIIFYFEYAHLG